MKYYVRVEKGSHAQNEDAYAIMKLAGGFTLFLVADGVSTCPNSGVFAENFVSRFGSGFYLDAEAPEQWAATIQRRLSAITSELGYYQGFEEAAATVTGALLTEQGELLLFWLGDSPAFLISENGATPLTFPHNTAARNAGLLKRSLELIELPSERLKENRLIEGRLSGRNRALERFVCTGSEEKEEVEELSFTYLPRLEEGYRVLIGSDGAFYGGLPDSTIKGEEYVNELLWNANHAERDAKDDKTVIVIQI